MKIDEMQAGREMDMLIAEHVTKATPKIEWMASDDNGKSGYFFSNYKSEVGAWIDKTRNSYPESDAAKSEIFGIKHYPKYSTDIAAAFEVAEKIREKHFINILAAEKGWGVEIGDYYTRGTVRWFSNNDTIPLAICRAGLKAVLGKDEI